MKRITHLVIGGMASMALLAACSEADGYLADRETGGAEDNTYVSLSFAVPADNRLARANNPTGGEEGDGDEPGQSYENAISTAVAFLFKHKDGVNAPAATPVTHVYFDRVSLDAGTSTYTTETQTVRLASGTYHVLAVANPGNLDWAAEEAGGLTLGTVRDHIEKQAWTGAAASPSNFVMTSEADATIALTGNNDEEQPARATVNVERMAARIDYRADGTFDCTDPDYDGATVTITGAALVNDFTAGSYLLKRVNTGPGTAVDYLGDETADATDRATNYVVDPWTHLKDKQTTAFPLDGNTVTLDKLYGRYLHGTGTQADPAFWASAATAGTTVTASDGTAWQRVGYTLENTTYQAYTDHRYATAVVFKARFTPADGTVVTGYHDGYAWSAGHTFFKWQNRLFATAEDMMAAWDAGFATYDARLEACKTWTDVATLAADLAAADPTHTADPTGYTPYLAAQAAAQADPALALTADDRAALSWTAYMSARCGYSYTKKAGVVLNRFGQDAPVTSTRVALEPYGVQTYENAQCYYLWWVRHGNDLDDSANGVMEYAVVRNNIYQLSVESVYSLGGDVPDDQELGIHVYVRNWTLLPGETIDM